MKTYNNRPVLLFVIILFLVFICLYGSAIAAEFNLRWQANPAGEGIVGYKIHYNEGSTGPPYGVTIDVGNVTEYPLSGLSDTEIIFFAITPAATCPSVSLPEKCPPPL